MDLIQRQVKPGTTSVKLAWTPRLLLSPTAMEVILTDPENKMVSIGITVMSVEDKDKDIKNCIFFGSKYHRVDGFTEISPDTLCVVCCYWNTSLCSAPTWTGQDASSAVGYTGQRTTSAKLTNTEDAQEENAPTRHQSVPNPEGPTM